MTPEKEKIIAEIFKDPLQEDVSTPLQRGKYYGGVYNGKRFMYSDTLITSMSPEKLQSFIKRQVGI